MTVRTGQRIVMIDDDQDFLDGMKRILMVNGFRAVSAYSCATEAVDSLEKEGAAVILLDMVMPGISGRELLPILIDRYPDVPVIISSAVSEVDNVVSCMKIGAYDYLTKPVDTRRLLLVLGNAIRLSSLNQENRRLKEYLLGIPLSAPDLFDRIITRNARMKAIFKLMETFARTMRPVLITGETGTGKELVASVIHGLSGVGGAFVAVNAGGVDGARFADNLFGSCVSGVLRGGLIDRAEGGTLFLDEVGDLSRESQIALLRLLQEGEYYRNGSEIPMRSSARIIAASNRDLRQLIDSGSFRSDLFHRLSAHQIQLPPLRERSEDIPLLVQHYAEAEATHLGKEPPQIPRELMDALTAFEYPGNVRELINMVRNGVALSDGGHLSFDGFPLLPRSKRGVSDLFRVSNDDKYTIHAVFDRFPTMEQFERLVIEEAIRFGGSKANAAELLGISRPTLNRKINSGGDD